MPSGHWDSVWRDRHPDEVTWFQAEPTISMRLIECISKHDDSIIDVGGGASRLVDHLLDAGYHDITVLDIAAASISAAGDRLGSSGTCVDWVVADATTVVLGRTFDIWHDRAVFHFLTDPDERARYLTTLNTALPIGGHLVLSTFGPDGPETCSGLPVRRYSAISMQTMLGDGFELIADEIEHHVAPSGVAQQFVYGLFRRVA